MTVPEIRIFKFCYAICLSASVIFSACSASKEKTGDTDEDKKTVGVKESGYYSAYLEKINKSASEEQLNSMYSRSEDTAFLYWLDNQVIVLNNSTKCNIFALNVLFKAGFKCPESNALTFDLMDTSKFNDVFPVIKFTTEDDLNEKLRPGDLIIWNGHVIIFESAESVNGKDYAVAWWAGTRQEDNGENIINNVIHGRYPLEGYFIARRPLRRK